MENELSPEDLEALRAAETIAKQRRQDAELPTETAVAKPDFNTYLRLVGKQAGELSQLVADREPNPVDLDAQLRSKQLSSIPQAFRWASFDSPDLARRIGSVTAIADARRAVGASRMVLVGMAGCGKTSLLAAMLRAWTGQLRSEARGGFFVASFRLALARQAHPLGDGEPPEVARALGTPLLCLDELGAEPMPPTSAVAEVIHERHAQGRPTWVTSGLGDAESGPMQFELSRIQDAIAKRYGDGVARRLLEGATVINCAGGA